jgi:hypothetical protein
MATEIKRDIRDKPNMKILVETERFDRRLDKSEGITGRARKTLLEPSEKGWTCPVYKTGQPSLSNRILQF